MTASMVGALGLISPAFASAAGGSPAVSLVPHGATVRGSAYYQLTSTVPGFFQFGINLPAKARNDLSPDNVNFAPDSYAATTDDDASCTGTYTLPTAPAGKVCVYLWPSAPLSPNVTSILVGGDAPGSPEFSRNGFYISWSTAASASNAVYVYARWAYTAP